MTMRLSRRSQLLLRLGTGADAGVHLRAAARDRDLRVQHEPRTFEWPPPGFTLEWFDKAIDNTGARDAFLYSVEDRRCWRPAIALDPRHARLARRRPPPLLRPRDDLVPGHPADRAARGSSPAIALNSTFTQVLGIELEPVHDRRRPRHLLHRRRLQQRRSPGCGGCRPRSRRRRPTSARPRGRRSAGSRCRTCAPRSSPARCWPSRSPSTRSSSPRSPIGAGDETLPIWIFNNFSRPNQLPIVNVVAVLVILISIIPVYLAHRLTRGRGRRRRRPRRAAPAPRPSPRRPRRPSRQAGQLPAPLAGRCGSRPPSGR